MSSKNPEISVVMPVLNGERFLRDAVKSILNQTFSDFEFIIINDGSTDKTDKIIRSFNDPRIVYVKSEINHGLSPSYNQGIQIAKGKFIARMDADDLSLPRRFETQITYLKENLDVGIVGSSAILIDENGKKIKTFYRPSSHILLKWSSLFSTPFIHPSVMARAEILKKNPFDEKIFNSEDYDLWSRLLFETDVKFANIRKSLLCYRVSKGSFTQTLKKDKRMASAENSIKNIRHYYSLNDKEKELIITARKEEPMSLSDLFKVWSVYLEAAKAFCVKELPSTSNKARIYAKLFSSALFFAKYKFKQIIR